MAPGASWAAPLRAAASRNAVISSNDILMRLIISLPSRYYMCTEKETEPNGQGRPMLALAFISKGKASA